MSLLDISFPNHEHWYEVAVPFAAITASTLLGRLYDLALCTGASSCCNRKEPSLRCCHKIGNIFVCCSINSTPHWRHLNSIISKVNSCFWPYSVVNNSFLRVLTFHWHCSYSSLFLCVHPSSNIDNNTTDPTMYCEFSCIAKLLWAQMQNIN